MRTFIIADTHFGHDALHETMGERPPDFEARIVANWNRMIDEEDMIIHLGDVVIGNQAVWQRTVPLLQGRKFLVRGNHDKRSCSWYIKNGFDFCCETFTWQLFGLNILFSHEPRIEGSFDLNIHGHYHGDDHHEDETDERHCLVALERTGYQPLLLKTIVAKWQGGLNHGDGVSENRAEESCRASQHDSRKKEVLALMNMRKRGSVSYIQRRLKIGFNQAAELIEQLKDEGLI